MPIPTLTSEVTASSVLGEISSLQRDVNHLLFDAPDIEQALAQVKAKEAQYKRAANYYLGDHRLVYATDKFRNAFGDLFYAVADNLCQLVIDAMADRLQVVGFGAEKGEKRLPEEAWKIWQANRMDDRAGQVHREALRAGDGYVLVWPDPAGQPVIWPQLATCVTVKYDDERPEKLLWAAKVWRKDKNVRVNLYYADRIEKYITRSCVDAPSKADAFEHFEMPGEPWPVPNRWDVVPIFHFANNAWIGSFGQSELASVAPLQDALNTALSDLLVSMEFAAFQQRWATGIEAEIDEITGKAKEPFKAGIDRLWTTGNDQARFGQFEVANLEGFLKVQESLRIEIARIVGLPPHYVAAGSGANMSGEALKTAESRFVKKIKARQGAFGNSWENAMKLALQIAGTGSKGDRLTTMWEPAAPISETELLNNLLVKQQLGASEPQVLSEAGYGEADIARMLDEKAKAADDQRRRFNAGIPDGGEDS